MGDEMAGQATGLACEGLEKHGFAAGGRFSSCD